MMGVFDPYAVLGVPENATLAEIRKAYLAQAKLKHPDIGGDPVAFAELGRAWAILRDPALRRRHDRGEDPLDQRGRVRVRALDIIATLLDQLVRHPHGIGDKDLVALLKVNLEARFTDATERLETVSRQIEDAKTARSRLGRTKADRLIRSMLDAHMAAWKQVIPAMKLDVEVATHALKAVEGASFTIPKPPPPAPFPRDLTRLDPFYQWTMPTLL